MVFGKKKMLTWALALTIMAGSVLAFFRNAEAVSPAAKPKGPNVASIHRALKKEEESKKAKSAKIPEKDAKKIGDNLNKWTAELQILLKQRMDADQLVKKARFLQAQLRYKRIQESVAALGNAIMEMQATLDTFQAKQLLGKMAMRCEQLVSELDAKIAAMQAQLGRLRQRSVASK